MFFWRYFCSVAREKNTNVILPRQVGEECCGAPHRRVVRRGLELPVLVFLGQERIPVCPRCLLPAAVVMHNGPALELIGPLFSEPPHCGAMEPAEGLGDVALEVRPVFGDALKEGLVASCRLCVRARSSV